ncbi:hypothetical protein BFJ69_g14929 [Fusarium oxysporum]|uniref:Major facilitator superfamily (MFS) profile domain-containing protein n=1 Tax=Fusarium oxysporum TaxID=5507 RepID=A0A420MG21_FUSOX|nr:hypothetical protein BFJ69_g14929 [Fusarium oxysporum]
MLIAGRFFAGIGVGMISTMIPLYQSLSISPKLLPNGSELEKAACSLGRIRRLPSDHPAVEAELAEIQTSYNHEKSLGEASWLDCFRPPLLKRQYTGMAIQALQQLSGVNFIFTIALNASKILESQVAL